MNQRKLRTRLLIGVEGKTSRAQGSHSRDDSVHGDHSAGAGLLHSAGRLSTKRGPLSTIPLAIQASLPVSIPLSGKPKAQPHQVAVA